MIPSVLNQVISKILKRKIIEKVHYFTLISLHRPFLVSQEECIEILFWYLKSWSLARKDLFISIFVQMEKLFPIFCLELRIFSKFAKFGCFWPLFGHFWQLLGLWSLIALLISYVYKYSPPYLEIYIDVSLPCKKFSTQWPKLKIYAPILDYQKSFIKAYKSVM